MTPDTLARLQAPLHHLIPHSLLLLFGHLWYRWFLADLVEFTVVDGHLYLCCRIAAMGLPELDGRCLLVCYSTLANYWIEAQASESAAMHHQ